MPGHERVECTTDTLVGSVCLCTTRGAASVADQAKDGVPQRGADLARYLQVSFEISSGRVSDSHEAVKHPESGRQKV